MKYAIVDLGSNTVRLSVYNILEDGDFELLFSEKEMAGLAGYIDHGRLTTAGMERACGALSNFQTLLAHFNMREMHVFATASLRNIYNTGEAVEYILKRTGLKVDVLSGDQEARLGYYGAARATHMQDGAMFDIGGGSTEILTVAAGEIQKAQSLGIGSLNLFNQYVSKIWPKKSEIEGIRGQIGRVLSEAELPSHRYDWICGVGGTARAVLKIANAQYARGKECRVITLDELDRLTGLLLQRDQNARRLILRACPDRIHTILPGILLMNTLCSAMCRGEIFISQYGVREGYLCHKLISNGI